MTVLRRILQFFRENPLPLFALLGLTTGIIFWFVVGRPELASLIWLFTLVVGGAPVVWHTLRGMLHGKFAADVVAMLAILTALATGEYFAGVIIVLMQTGGEALENYSLKRASSSLEQLLARAPSIAHRKTDSQINEIPVAEVLIGDTLVVRPGDLIPVDGTLISAEAEVDEAALTGEPLAEAKVSGAPLLSGSINVGGAFEMQATRLSANSQYALIVELVRRAQDEKPPLQRLADKYAVWFLPFTLVVCAIGWLITGQAETVLAVLVVATPCPLILAVPVAVISGINRAAKYGIIVKGGTAIENVGRAQAIVFDKTGTLTFGSPTVQSVIPANGTSPHEILRLAGSVEQVSGHVLAQTLARTALQQTGNLPMPLNMREVAGFGVSGEVEGHRVVVGSSAFLEQETGKPLPPLENLNGELTTFVAIDRKFAGTIAFSDHLRPGVPEFVLRLRSLGIKHIAMLTGDRSNHSDEIARQIGADGFEIGLLPEGKVEALGQIKAKYHPMVMVGDGINDAPALATATVGIAMGAQGTGISAEAADIVLLVDDVTRVADAVEIGQRMLHIAKQSIYVGMGLSGLLMILAAFGYITPVIGALMQEVIDVAVILNALRARS